MQLRCLGQLKLKEAQELRLKSVGSLNTPSPNDRRSVVNNARVIYPFVGNISSCEDYNMTIFVFGHKGTSIEG